MPVVLADDWLVLIIITPDLLVPAMLVPIVVGAVGPFGAVVVDAEFPDAIVGFIGLDEVRIPVGGKDAGTLDTVVS